MRPVLVLSALAGVLTLSACGTTRIVEVAAPEAAEAASEPEETDVEEGEFLTWFYDNADELAAAADGPSEVADLIDGGDITEAADASEEAGEVFTDLYMDAPEDGTPLSDAVNEMLLTCGAAYTDAGNALHDLDVSAIEAATEALDDCSSATDDATELLP